MDRRTNGRTDRQRQTDRDSQRERDRERQTDTEIETERDRQTNRQTEKQGARRVRAPYGDRVSERGWRIERERVSGGGGRGSTNREIEGAVCFPR